MSAAKKYPKHSLGVDHFHPKEFLAAPEVSMAPVADAMENALQQCVLPLQLQLNLNPLLGKPKGFRTICKTPMLYRMVCRSDRSVAQWEKENHSAFDHASKGSSALVAGLRRGLKAELAIALGDQAGGVFNDFDKFQCCTWI